MGLYPGTRTRRRRKKRRRAATEIGIARETETEIERTEIVMAIVPDMTSEIEITIPRATGKRRGIDRGGNYMLCMDRLLGTLYAFFIDVIDVTIAVAQGEDLIAHDPRWRALKTHWP